MKEKVSVIISFLALMGVATVFGLQLAPDGTQHDTAVVHHPVNENRQEAPEPRANMKAGNELPGTAVSPALNRKTEADSSSSPAEPADGIVPQLSEVPTREELFALQRQRRMEHAIETGTLNEFLEAEDALEQERSQREEQRRARLEESRRNREMRKTIRSRQRNGDEEEQQ